MTTVENEIKQTELGKGKEIDNFSLVYMCKRCNFGVKMVLMGTQSIP